MSTLKVMVNGIRINGKWYWAEAMYGLRGWVYCNEPEGKTVDLYDMGGKQICTANLLELGE